MGAGRLWVSRVCLARLDVACAARVSLHLHEARRGGVAGGGSDSHGADDRDAARHDALQAEAGRLFPARSFLFSLSRLPAERYQAFTRWSLPGRRRR